MLESDTRVCEKRKKKEKEKKVMAESQIDLLVSLSKSFRANIK